MNPEIYIEVHRASLGDAFVINLYGKNRSTIVIDMGVKDTYYNSLQQCLKNCQKIDLLVFTHIDNDHIQGGIEFYKDKINKKNIPINEVWYNTYRHLIQANDADELLKENDKKILIKIKESIDLDEEYENFIDIGVIEATTLAAQIFKQNFTNWNQTFNTQTKSINAVCIENIPDEGIMINGEVKIILLSPTKNDLEKLRKDWISKLKKNKGYKGTITNEKIFDDVFELMYRESYTNRYQDISDISSKHEDSKTSPTNASSITFIIEFYKYKLLFTGDVCLNQIIPKIQETYHTDEKIIFDVLKVPHHGSKNNVDKNSLSKIDSKKYIISTDGKQFSHPDIETIKNIVERDLPNNISNREIVLNYRHIAEKIQLASITSEARYTIKYEDQPIQIVYIGEDKP